MPLDEATLRKAATWQDFKEAQGLLNIGAVIDSEETRDGWKGTVKSGKRIFRPTVTARTATWLDATCACPANQREGRFCTHAVAAGLHLISPPAETAPLSSSPVAVTKSATADTPPPGIPAIAWNILLQGNWRTALSKGRLPLTLKTSDETPTPADEKLTAWLLKNHPSNQKTIPLILATPSLPAFLGAIGQHPRITSDGKPFSIDSGQQIHLTHCYPENDTLILRTSPSPSQTETLLPFASSIYSLSETSLTRIGSAPLPEPLLPVLNTLAETNQTAIPSALFLKHLETLQNHLDLSSSDWFQALQFIPQSPDFRLYLTGSENQITLTLTKTYPTSPLPKLTGNTILTQDPAAERNTLNLLSKTAPLTFGKPSNITDPTEIRTLLTRTLPSLPSSWETSLSPALEKLASSYVFISPKIKILSSETEDLSFTLTYETESGQTVPPAEIRRLLRSSGQRIGDKNVILSNDIENLIDPLLADLEIEQSDNRFTAKNASAAIIREIADKLSNPEKTNLSETSPQVIHTTPPPPIKATLRPYQSAGFSWIADRMEKYQGALLADDMGLGKTLQTIAFLEHIFTTYSHSSPALVVVTTSLLGNWKAEINRFAPHRKIITLHGVKRDSLREKVQPGTIVLTTYSTLARDLAYHLRQHYSTVVIDEASLIRNPDTDHSKAVARLKADHRLALSGTPVENSARDLWSIFRFIQPGWLGTRKDFEERYQKPLESGETAPRASTLLRLKTSPFVLRRTKSQVAPDLPSKIHIDEYCPLSKEQLSTYRELQKQGLARIQEIRDSGQTAAARMQTLTTLLRLRQTCCDLALLNNEKLKALPIPRRSGKLERLLEITTQAIPAGSRILVFSQFQKQLLEIENALTSLEIPSLRLDGQTRNRQTLVDQFQSPSGPPVFLISLKAGGYGLNLTAADIVIHFDPWWNPAAEAQATDRAHRIGQTKPVTVFRLLTKDTVEEKVTRLQASKKALADSLDESATPTDAPAWSASELEKLLKS
ncbi:MAG: SNF2-related protein [Luteolibacter sp.]